MNDIDTRVGLYEIRREKEKKSDQHKPEKDSRIGFFGFVFRIALVVAMVAFPPLLALAFFDGFGSWLFNTK